MFCRNCGKELTGNPEICPNCGARPMNGTSFCPNCAAPTTELTEICPKCGARVAGKVVAKAGSTWMPLTAGILDLVAGVPALIIGILVAAGLGALGWISGIAGVGVIMAVMGVPLIIFAIIAIVGGVFALRKRIWGLALAGSIFALFCACILGIPAIVFIAMGKGEFQ
jgi:RNA polymerase subunit RPABC4/transcription elongation factor Spt4